MERLNVRNLGCSRPTGLHLAQRKQLEQAPVTPAAQICPKISTKRRNTYIGRPEIDKQGRAPCAY
jgi:hypothetical protein